MLMISIKSIFWTSIFWLFLFFSGFLYLRLLNTSLVSIIFGLSEGNFSNEKVDYISNKVDDLSNSLSIIDDILNKNISKLDKCISVLEDNSGNNNLGGALYNNSGNVLSSGLNQTGLNNTGIKSE